MALFTGEMMHAVASGFDWLHHQMTDIERGTLTMGIVEKNFVLAHTAYTHDHNAFWKGTNPVCITGCLAVLDVDEVYKNATAAFTRVFALTKRMVGGSKDRLIGNMPPGMRLVLVLAVILDSRSCLEWRKQGHMVH